jgi:hypothetical protein
LILLRNWGYQELNGGLRPRGNIRFVLRSGGERERKNEGWIYGGAETSDFWSHFTPTRIHIERIDNIRHNIRYLSIA